jgi:hypothetical protein
LSIQHNKTYLVTITKNYNVTIIETAKVCFSFTSKKEQYIVIFYFLLDYLYNVILENIFLKVTKILILFTSRIKKRVVENLLQYNILYFGESALRFIDYLNSCLQKALADTEAKVLIIDKNYARSIGLQIDRTRKVKLCFSNNSTAYTSSITYSVE